MADAFISYSRNNKLFADRLATELEKNNRTVWIDRVGIKPTTQWWEEIQHGIEASDNFILIMSPASLSSPVCHLEIEHARKLTKRIIPVYHIDNDYKESKEHFGKRLYEDDKDGFLLKLYGDHNPLRVFEDNWAILPGLNRVDELNVITTNEDGKIQTLDEAQFLLFFPVLRQALDTDIVYVHQHTRLATRAQDWDKSIRKVSFLLNGDETAEAEEWLNEWEHDTQERQTKNLAPKNPQPDNTLRDFIKASRIAEDQRSTQAKALIRRTRILVLASVLLVVLLVATSMVGANAATQANLAGAQLSTATIVHQTSIAQVATSQRAADIATQEQGRAQNAAASANAAQVTAQQDVRIAQIQVTIVGMTLTPVPSTLTAVAVAIADAKAEGDISSQLANANSRLIEKSPKEALRIANGLVNKYPEKASAFFSRGLIYYLNKQYENAIADLTKAIELDPKLVQAYMDRGNSYELLNQYDKALADFTKTIDLDPNSVYGYNNRSSTYMNLGQYDKAFDDLNKATDLDPNFPYPYNNRGFLYEKLGQYDKAIDDYSKAIDLDPNFPLPHLGRGLVYYDLGQYEKAIDDYTRAIEIDPNFASAYNNRGNAYYALNQYDKALSDFTKAIEINPRYVFAHYNRSRTYKTLKEYDKAIADSTKAIKFDPKYANAYLIRGTSYYLTNQYRAALADWKLYEDLGETLSFEVEQYRANAEEALTATPTTTMIP